MPRFKPVDYDQSKLIPILFKDQLVSGSFEHALDYLVDHELDFSIFDHRYNNENTGASAYSPAVLLKVVIYAYSRGITSSRAIARLCEENIIFMALSADTRPHFTTIAKFVANLPDEISTLFKQVLLICDAQGLIGKQMFAIDGCKLPSNASKEWSGTKADMEKKVEKLEQGIENIIKKHQSADKEGSDTEIIQKDLKQKETLQNQANKIKAWLKDHEDKKGTNSKPIKSNITDNESAKMKTSNGVIQGYTGVNVVDEKNQVITNARAFGSGNEQQTLLPMIEETRRNFKDIGHQEDIFKKTKLSADSGFCSEKNLEEIYKEGIDAYIADHLFRKRDERFKTSQNHKPDKPNKKLGKFTQEDFHVVPDKKICICPANKQLTLQSSNATINGQKVLQFKAKAADCRRCPIRGMCLSKIGQKSSRQLNWFGTNEPEHQKFTKLMQTKIDSEEGKHLYSKRLGIVEPVFGNIVSNIGLKRFSLRGKRKVNAQWLLFCLVHNIGKLQKHTKMFAL